MWETRKRCRGVGGRALMCKPPVQLFFYASETQLEIEFTSKKPIKTQCKTPHPQPLSPSTARCTTQFSLAKIFSNRVRTFSTRWTGRNIAGAQPTMFVYPVRFLDGQQTRQVVRSRGPRRLT